MNVTPLVALSLTTAFFMCLAAQDPSKENQKVPEPIAMQVWQIEDVLAAHRKSERSYTQFFRVPSSHCGVYTLPKDGADGQSPHAEDELYYVVRGKASMECDGRTVKLAPGSVVFVAAHAEHRFVEIEEDLELLVVFSSGKTQPAAKPTSRDRDEAAPQPPKK